jgi:hypothetical protein
MSYIVSLPSAPPRWTAEYQRRVNAALEQAFARLNPFAQVPAGGDTDQVLAKTSGRSYDLKWAAPGGGVGGGNVSNANSPNAGEFARFTDSTHIEGLTLAEMKTALAYSKSDVGLANVDNTSDANKPISTAQAAALKLKASNSLSFFLGS